MDKFIDLHLHLDGAITPAIARELAALQDMPLPEKDADLEKLLTVQPDCKDLNEFLACFQLPIALLQTPEALTAAVRLVSENIRSQGVIYAELRFAPQSHTAKKMTQEDAVKAALKGLSETALKANLILCCMRGSDNYAANLETLELCRKYLVPDGGVVALDLAGAEALFPTADYRSLFQKAAAYGIPFTIHAGEADGPYSVRNAIEFGARRIGHGVRSADDPEVIRLIREKGIPLEMCPTSNRQTRAIEDLSKYPLIPFLDQGIKVTINTDDMGIEGTTLAKEFEYLEEAFHLTAEQKKRILMNAAEAAFTTDEVKTWLKSSVDSGFRTANL